MNGTSDVDALMRRRAGLALLRGVDPSDELNEALATADAELATLTTPKPKRFLTQQRFEHEMDALARLLADTIKAMERRIADLEQRPELKYTDARMLEREYVPGNICTDKGALWLCVRAVHRTRPGTSGDWKLIVKSHK